MSNQEKIQQEIDRLSQLKRKDMTSLERVRLLQLKLYLKAKQEKDFKFYTLYDKLCLKHVLEVSYLRCKQNNGSPGVDKQTFAEIEENGREKFLLELSDELFSETYRPKPVKRVWIEKANGGKRPLGIPTIKDRVAQQACKLIIEPIFEVDFDESSYGFGRKLSSKDAIKAIRSNLQRGNTEVYDADLSKYFDTIPHDKLEIALRERISDPRVLHLIRLWLQAPIVDEDGKYQGGKKNKTGTPQGGVISPLLANIYMNLLDRIVNNPHGYFQREGINMIRYADDFILMAKHIKSESVDRVHHYLERMGLTINTEKSKLINAREESFDFLGFRFQYKWSLIYRNSKYWNIEPRPKSRQRLRQKINIKLKRIGHYSAPFVVKELNPIIRGWINYYRIEKVSHTQKALKELKDYLRGRLFRYYNRKSQRKSRLYGQQAFDKLVKEYGLIDPYRTSGLRPVNAIK